MCPQVELQPVRIAGAPLDVSLTSRWPLLARLSLQDSCYRTVKTVLTSSGAEVTVGCTEFSPADTHRQLQGMLDGFIRPRWGRWLQHTSLQPARATRSLHVLRFRRQRCLRHCCCSRCCLGPVATARFNGLKPT
jgi:hypothetical protein